MFFKILIYLHIVGCATIVHIPALPPSSVELPVILIRMGTATNSAGETTSKKKSVIPLQPLKILWQLRL